MAVPVLIEVPAQVLAQALAQVQIQFGASTTSLTGSDTLTKDLQKVSIHFQNFLRNQNHVEPHP